MIMLHVVTRALPPGAETEGLSVRTMAGVSVLHEWVDGEPTLDQDALVEHGRRIVSLGERCAVLPMRYGTTVATPAELDALISEHAAAWLRRLDVVEGHFELLIHLDPPSPTRGDARTGREYLLHRAEALHLHDGAWRAVEDVVGPWCRERRRLADGRRLAVLVPRDQIAGCRGSIDAWSRANPAVGVAVTGPWPPFTFCEEAVAP